MVSDDRSKPCFRLEELDALRHRSQRLVGGPRGSIRIENAEGVLLILRTDDQLEVEIPHEHVADVVEARTHDSKRVGQEAGFCRPPRVGNRGRV